MYISGVGCAIQDFIYVGVDFMDSKFARFLHYGANKDIATFEKESGVPVVVALKDLTGDAVPQKRLGGVCVIALICASQLLEGEGIPVCMYKNVAAGANGQFVMDCISRTPLRQDKIRRKEGRAAATYALCDTQKKEGTRTFISCAHEYEELALDPGDLDDAFYKSDFTVFNCFYWEPKIEAVLSRLLARAKREGSITLVGTAFDTRFKGRQWVLGDGDKGYPFIDVLMMDRAEAEGYSACTGWKGMKRYFSSRGVKCFIVTDGRNPTYAWAGDGGPFAPFEGLVPVETRIDEDKEKGILPQGDGVGCGDNFSGGVLASLAAQKKKGAAKYDILDAVLLGNVAGGLASTVVGGAYYEKEPGEKKKLTLRYYAPYREEVRKEFGLS